VLREIEIYGNHFYDFFEKLDKKTKEKVTYVLDLIKFQWIVSEKFLKHMEGTEGIYEIRVKTGSNIYRIFCFFDKDKLIVLFNGFQKKTSKTPKKELELAISLKKEYLSQKIKNGK